MSKIGIKSIAVEPGVTVKIEDKLVSVSGPKGNLSVTLPRKIDAKLDGAVLTVSRTGEDAQTKAFHGLFRSLIANAVQGVSKGWEKRLEVVGTGFGVTLKGNDAVFKVGFSHTVVFPQSEGIKFAVDGPTKIIVSGADKQLVGQVAYLMRSIRKPDPYKGKGVRYEGEYIKLKPGKKAKTA